MCPSKLLLLTALYGVAIKADKMQQMDKKKLLAIPKSIGDSPIAVSI